MFSPPPILTCARFPREIKRKKTLSIFPGSENLNVTTNCDTFYTYSQRKAQSTGKAHFSFSLRGRDNFLSLSYIQDKYVIIFVICKKYYLNSLEEETAFLKLLETRECLVSRAKEWGREEATLRNLTLIHNNYWVSSMCQELGQQVYMD